jgi:hypothetical protein
MSKVMHELIWRSAAAASAAWSVASLASRG